MGAKTKANFLEEDTFWNSLDFFEGANFPRKFFFEERGLTRGLERKWGKSQVGRAFPNWGLEDLEGAHI